MSDSCIMVQGAHYGLLIKHVIGGWLRARKALLYNWTHKAHL